MATKRWRRTMERQPTKNRSAAAGSGQGQGTYVDSMSLHLYDDSNTQVVVFSDDSRSVGFYSPNDKYQMHVVDLDPSSVTSGGWLEDTSLVDKYTISQEAYDKLDDKFNLPLSPDLL